MDGNTQPAVTVPNSDAPTATPAPDPEPEPTPSPAPAPAPTPTAPEPSPVTGEDDSAGPTLGGDLETGNGDNTNEDGTIESKDNVEAATTKGGFVVQTGAKAPTTYTWRRDATEGEKNACRERLKSHCYLGGSVKDVGTLGGVAVEIFFRTTFDAVRLFAVCTILSIPLLIVNWARAPGPNRFLQGLLNYPIVTDEAELTYLLYGGLTLLQFIFILAFLVIVPFVSQREARVADLARTTDSDFAVRVRNIPPEANEVDIANYFATWGDVVLTTLVYKTENLRKILRNLQALTHEPQFDPHPKWFNVIPKPSCCVGNVEEEHKQRVAKYRRDKETWEARFETAKELLKTKRESSGTAFVVFKKETSAQECITLLSRTFIDQVVYYIQTGKYSVKPKFCVERSGKPPVSLIVDRAPEPSNIAWENAELSTWDVTKRHAKTFFVMGILIAISFGIIVVISIEQSTLTEKSYILSLLAPATILFINWLIVFIARVFVKWERHSTREGGQVSMLTKVVVAQCANSVIILVAVFWGDRKEWFHVEDVSLGTKAIELVLLNTIMPSIASVLYYGSMKLFLTFLRDPLFQLLKRPVPAAKHITPELSMWYANIIKTFALGMLYGPISPLVYPLSLVSLVILYFQYRYSFLKFELQFAAMFDRVSVRALNLMTLLGLLYVAISIIIASTLKAGVPTVCAIVATILWTLKLILPAYWLEKKLFELRGRTADLLALKQMEEQLAGREIMYTTDQAYEAYRPRFSVDSTVMRRYNLSHGELAQPSPKLPPGADIGEPETKLAPVAEGVDADTIDVVVAESKPVASSANEDAKPSAKPPVAGLDHLMRGSLGVARGKHASSKTLTIRQAHGAIRTYQGIGAGLVLCCGCCAKCVEPMPAPQPATTSYSVRVGGDIVDFEPNTPKVTTGASIMPPSDGGDPKHPTTTDDDDGGDGDGDDSDGDGGGSGSGAVDAFANMIQADPTQ